MASIEEWIELLTLKDKVLAPIEHSTLQEKYILMLTSRISELCLDAVILLNEKRLASTPIILRTALESYADLLACIKDSDHPEIMTKSLHWQFYEFHNGKNEERAEHYKNIGKFLPVKKRFSKAGISELFDGYYKSLSLHSHGNVSSMIDMHSKENAVYLGTIQDDEMTCTFFGQVVNLLALTLKDFFMFFNISDEVVSIPQGIMDKINGNS